MAKSDLVPVVGGYNLSAINNNFQKIEDALNSGVLWRNNPEGEPNQMVDDLDMNAQRIYNLPEPVADHEAARFKEIKEVRPLLADVVAQANRAVAAADASENARDLSNAYALASDASADRAQEIETRMEELLAQTDIDEKLQTAVEAAEAAATLGNLEIGPNLTADPEWVSVPSVVNMVEGATDPLNAQAQSLLDRTQWARDALESTSDPTKGPGILSLNQELNYPNGSVGAAILSRDLPELRVSQALTTAQLRSSIDTPLDITAALTSLINLSKSTGFRGIFIDVPKAKITAPLPQLNVSFDFVKLRGLGQGKTQLDVSEAGQTPFVYSGGSGGHAGTVIEGLTINGADTQDIFLNKGFCGADVVDCKINGRVIGVLSNDIGAGTFTEFFRLVRCNIFCDVIFTMQRGAGNDSFHGCGWPGSIINQRASGNCLVLLGAASDTGRAIWYHGEIESTIFPRQSSGALFVNGNPTFASTSFVSTVGCMRVEYFGSGAPVVSSVFSHIHSGGYFELTGGAVKMGTMRPASSGGFSLSTVPAYTMTEGRASKQTVNTTSAVIEGADYGCGRLLFVWVQGGNYEYLQLVACAGRISGGIAPNVVVVATLRQFDVAGWGPPTYAMGDTTLTVSGPWVGPVSVQVSELPGTLKPF